MKFQSLFSTYVVHVFRASERKKKYVQFHFLSEKIEMRVFFELEFM